MTDLTCPAAFREKADRETVKKAAPSSHESQTSLVLLSPEIIADFLQKHKKSYDQSVWALATRKEILCARLNEKICARDYLFGMKSTSITLDGKKVSFYSDWQDRLVEFALFRYLKRFVMERGLVSKSYLSWEGGGRVRAIHQLRGASESKRHVFKTDIKSYYQSIRIERLWKKIHALRLPEPALGLLSQTLTPMLDNSVRSQYRGILQGSSISYFYAWAYLADLDAFFDAREDTFYQRFMDDIVILGESEAQIMELKTLFYREISKLKLKTRYEKTFIGTFDSPLAYLGYKISHGNLFQSRESKKRREARLLARAEIQLRRPRPEWREDNWRDPFESDRAEAFELRDHRR